MIKEVTAVENINNSTIVGIEFKANKQRVMPLQSKKDCFYGISKDAIMIEPEGYEWTERSKKLYVIEALKQEGTKVYIFETVGELFRWMTFYN